jgi:RHS repeat-associated protein
LGLIDSKVYEIQNRELRYSWTSSQTTTPAYKLTKYPFTGQYSDSYINLLWYGSRHYDPALGRFIQPDSIVPLASQGVQAWDRYAYVNNNPVRYTDPSGHMLDDGCRTEGCGEWKPKSNADKQNWAFTIMFKGSGIDDAWTRADWNFYLDNQRGLWAGDIDWWNSDDVTGWDLFALHAERLASRYDSNQGEQFVRDFALVFAGMSATKPWYGAAWYALEHSHGEYDYLTEGNEGLQDQYQDTNHPGENASHHYAALFFLGYFGTAPGGILGNLGRDADFWNREPDQGYNPGDVALGNAAALDGARFRGDPRLRPHSPMDVVGWIRELSQ